MNKLLKIILAVLIPPAAVAMETGFDKTFFLNLVLTILFVIPGVVHALIVVM